MNEKAFIETMINTLKFDRKFMSKKEKLIPILRRASINSIPQWAFIRNSGRSGQKREDIEVRVPVPLIDEANDNYTDLVELASYVYKESDDFGLGSISIRPQILDSLVDSDIEHDVIFTEIQETVVQGIRDAKFLIWSAVAWFSNEAILKELVVKKQQGLDIRLIISDEDSNKRLLPELQKNINVVIIPKHGWNDYNRMHDKFCIIDLDYVMHGSYNWTPTANHNEETLATALDKEFVKKFADEFMRMYIGNK